MNKAVAINCNNSNNNTHGCGLNNRCACSFSLVFITGDKDNTKFKLAIRNSTSLVFSKKLRRY